MRIMPDQEGQNQRGRLDIRRKKQRLFILVVAVVLAGIAMIIASFSNIRYYQMGFMKETFTGKVDRSKVYYSGRYFTGLGKSFKIFPRNAQFIDFNVTIFNADKLEVQLSGAIQYVLNKDELKHLHDAYNLGYKPIIEKTALEAVKNAAPRFTVQEFRLEREKISMSLLKSIRQALQGVCCSKDTVEYSAEPGCKAYDNCTVDDKGLFSIVKNFQLEVVGITKEQEDRFLKNVLEQERFYTEQFKQQEKVERKVTEQLKKVISNQAREVAAKASATFSYIKATAEASSGAILESARNTGLQTIFSELNITSETHKKSLDYVRTLLNHNSTHMYIGYSSLVGREGGK